MALRIARSALEDLRGIKAHYSEQGVAHIGREYVAAVLKHAEMLQQHPDAGRVVPEFNLDHIRELIHPPFRVVYAKQGTDLISIRVWRSERQLKLPDDGE